MPGQETGQSGFSWGDLVDGLVAERGSLAAVALHLAEQRAFAEDVESVERGLRRLRARGTGDGGVWGERAVRVFGLPAAVVDRVRWMGQYHTRFSDLPATLAGELIAPWDRPPVSLGPARVWLLLGRVNLALRRHGDVGALLAAAGLLAARAERAAQVELCLVSAYATSRRDPAATDAALTRAGRLLGVDGIDGMASLADGSAALGVGGGANETAAEIGAVRDGTYDPEDARGAAAAIGAIRDGTRTHQNDTAAAADSTIGDGMGAQIAAIDGMAGQMSTFDHACLFARWVDQVAYRYNRPRHGAPDHAAALGLYARIPADGPLFARCRRENGLGWTRLGMGDRAAAAAHALASVEAAGDAGSLRLRAMALNLLAAASEGEAAARAKARAVAIAAHLEDEALALRFDRSRARVA
ncbi:MAG: hypothetical protein H6701_17195 [Myxococcales bacterium]|nr:hypothetical protein [Myxococcales bacterium]